MQQTQRCSITDTEYSGSCLFSPPGWVQSPSQTQSTVDHVCSHYQDGSRVHHRHRVQWIMPVLTTRMGPESITDTEYSGSCVFSPPGWVQSPSQTQSTVDHVCSHHQDGSRVHHRHRVQWIMCVLTTRMDPEIIHPDTIRAGEMEGALVSVCYN